MAFAPTGRARNGTRGGTLSDLALSAQGIGPEAIEWQSRRFL